MAWSDLASNEVPRKDELADLINYPIVDATYYEGSYYKYFCFKIKYGGSSTTFLVNTSIHVIRTQFPGRTIKTFGQIPSAFWPQFTMASCAFDNQGGSSNAARMLYLQSTGQIVASGDSGGDYFNSDWASATFIYKRTS